MGKIFVAARGPPLAKTIGIMNTLQVVSSMLSLQSMNIEDPRLDGIFRESQDRVRSMALIHEKLCQSGDLSRIDFGEYARNLTAYLLRSYSSGGTIKLNTDVSDILLGIYLAIPCGLIINELVTNSLKYVFPEAEQARSPHRCTGKAGNTHW